MINAALVGAGVGVFVGWFGGWTIRKWWDRAFGITYVVEERRRSWWWPF